MTQSDMYAELLRNERDLGDSLIFLISLPRSGSTLLQHILASHSGVAATTEPWVLFPGICALKEGALVAAYNADIGRIALKEFLAQLDGGEDMYFAALRKAALELYRSYLREHNKQRFLDKTSRYYQVIPELYRVFPDAKFVFLLRNPLAMFASFLDVMVSGDWRRLGDVGIRNDLLFGYGLIQRGIDQLEAKAFVIHYERLVTDPEFVVSRLCEFLELRFEPAMLDYGGRIGVLPGTLRDPKSIAQHASPVTDYVDGWRSRLDSERRRYLARCFLAELGPDLIARIGYSFEELASEVEEREHYFPWMAQWKDLMTPRSRRSTLQRLRIGASFSFDERGFVGVLMLAAKCFVGRIRFFWRSH